MCSSDLDLLRGDPKRFDMVVQSSSISKNPARWLRFLLMLCGDIEPNPGPFRGQLDLTVGFVAATSQRMARCLEGFKIWVRDVAEVDWLPLTEDPQALDWVVLL